MNEEKYRIFQEPPDDLDATWRHGALLGGIVAYAYGRLDFANAFKLAGDSLVEMCLSSKECYQLIHPVLFNYRHSIELYLKAVINTGEKGHDLKHLSKRLIELSEKHFHCDPPEEVLSLISEFDEFDQKSFAFRYYDNGIVSHTTKDTGEFWVDFIELKKHMAQLQEYFSNLASQLGYYYSI